MSEKTFNAIIKLRRDSEANFEKVKNTFIPKKGEMCIVDTSVGMRIKIGDGVNTYAQLPFDDEQNNIVVHGYLLNGKFYTDSTYTVELEKSEKHLYIDNNGLHDLYVYITADGFVPVSKVATDVIAGIMKLYQTYGQNIDGTMTQKAITDGVTSIQFAVDDDDSECLILDLPWD